jgi:glycosyltransferase involved in cell wall biosynthesis
LDPNPNAFYRAIEPMRAMEGRGHEVVWPQDAEGRAGLRWLADCDVVHVYRRADNDTRPVLAKLVRGGTPITYDNDDDLTATPKDSAAFKRFGGYMGQRIFAASVQVAQMARTFTTTTQVLADKYRRAGVQRADVIGNYLAPYAFQPRRRHDGVVIGWVAAGEHQSDAAHMKIADVLQRLVAKHENVRVECIGVNLRLAERYRHDVHVQFFELPSRICSFDIGLAPIADTPFNRARSDIKLKEYAACGIPWLASPVGPYRGLGEEEGGRLVQDDGWFEALDRLVTRGRERRRLGRKAEKWAKRQTIDAVADRWEQVFIAAARGGSEPASSSA